MIINTQYILKQNVITELPPCNSKCHVITGWWYKLKTLHLIPSLLLFDKLLSNGQHIKRQWINNNNNNNNNNTTTTTTTTTTTNQELQRTTVLSLADNRLLEEWRGE
jgi:hypothetical protein